MAAEIPDGAVIVARAILNSSLWTMRPQDCKLAITCICIANWKANKIWFDGKELIIERGQFVRSLKQLCEASRMKMMEVRTSLNHLLSVEFLTRFLTKQSYIYTIPKYDKYQDLTKYADLEWQKANIVANKVSNKDLTRTQQGPNNKQEGEEREEGEGERQNPPPPAAPGGRPDPALAVVKAYRKADPSVPERKCYIHVNRVLSQGVNPGELLNKVGELRGTMKIWKICDLLIKEPKAGKTKCLNCGGTKKIAGDVVEGKITYVPCRICK